MKKKSKNKNIEPEPKIQYSYKKCVLSRLTLFPKIREFQCTDLKKSVENLILSLFKRIKGD